jgi:hypothetical protein
MAYQRAASSSRIADFWRESARRSRLKRQELLGELKQGSEITGVTLSNPEPVLSVRTR